ncbi:MAG: DUF1565 domain-containing protein [Cyanobacteria bacterium J06638_20]
MSTSLSVNGLSRRFTQGILVGLVLGGSIGLSDRGYALSPDAAMPSSFGTSYGDGVLMAQSTDRSAPATQLMLFVDPVLGSDETGEGTLRSPFRTITHAVQFAQTDTVIMLGAGTYSERTGEQFPIGLPPGVRLLEMPNGTITIQGQIMEGEAVAAMPSPEPPRPAPEANLPLDSPPTAPLALPEVATPASFAPPVDLSVTPAPEPAAIPIPVPPPAESREASPPALVDFQRRSPTANAPIEIPVPPPENPMPLAVGRSVQPTEQPPARPSQPVVQAAPPPQVNAVLPQSAPASNPNLLPVPNFDIPLGYVGDVPTVSIETFDLPGAPANLPATPVRTAARSPDPSLRYRVIVRLDNDALRGWIRSVVPDAFETTANGEPVMQIGAFQTVERAEAAAERLHQSGVRAIIQEF